MATCSSCSQPLPQGARFCPFCGTQTAAVADEERRLITVLFADIVGYTGLVEYLDPERAKRLLDDAFERLIANIVEFGGTIDKVLGDGVLALFGAPVAHEDDPDRALRAALRMHESLNEFVAEHVELTRPVQLRVGVNTGEVLFGRIGGTDDYTVMGDVVNVAARLEALAGPGEVYVGDLTATLASPGILLEPVDNLPVPGRQQSEQVWRVTGVDRDRSRFALQIGRETPFVGRESEWRVLADAIADAVAGKSRLVALSGEAGVGKTRLVAEVLDAASSQITVLAAACAPFGQTNVWAPIATAMFGHIDPTTTRSPELVQDLSVQKAMAEYGFGPDDPLLDRLVNGALHIAGHPSTLDDMPLAQARETLFRLIVEALRRRSDRGPLVLFIDDLHWADNLLVDLLHRIRRSLADRAFLLITAQRGDIEIDWPPDVASDEVVRLPLEPLGRTEATELMTAIIGIEVGQVLIDRLYERSGGNPLFLTELASLAGSAETIELPSSLRVLIAARLDRLEPATRSIIDNAAVLGVDGPIVSLEQFSHALGDPFSYEALTRLEEAGLMVLSPGRWRFRSDVVREVAYQTLTKVVRAERHAGVAQVMAGTPGIPINRVAHHAARAAELNREIGPLDSIPVDIAERAVQLLCRAARRSLDIGAFRQARRDVDRAMAIGPTSDDIERQLRLLRATASIELREYDFDGADIVAALESALATGNRHDEGTARRLIGIQAHGLGDLPTARRELDRSIEIFRELGDDAQLAISLADRGFGEIFGGSLSRADALLDESAAIAARLGDQRSRAWTREHKALTAFLSGDIQLAAARLDIATREFEELGDRGGTSWAKALKAYLAFYERRFVDAERLADEARVEALKLGERWAPAMMDSLVAGIRLWTGDFEEAERLSRQSLATFRELGDRFGMVQTVAPHIRSLVALGRTDEALRGMEEALTLSESSGSLAVPALAAAGTAVHLGIGERAVVIAQVAVDRIEEMGSNGAESRTALALAFCQTGRADDALAQLLMAGDAGPYTRAVSAVAHALVGDTAESLLHARAVHADDSATYLDRTIASIAAAASERRDGRPQQAQKHLEAAVAESGRVKDVVAAALCTAAAERFGLHVACPEPSVSLGAGWARLLDDLAT